MTHRNRILLLAVLLSALLLLPEASVAYHLAQHDHDHDEPCQICVQIIALITNRTQLLALASTLALVSITFTTVFSVLLHPQIALQTTLVSLNMKLTN